MQLSTILKAVAVPQENRSSETLLRLKAGDMLSGKVLRLEQDGRVLIDLGTFRALAHSNVPVQPGQTLRLQVVKGGIPLYLQTAVDQPASPDTAPAPRLAFTEALAPAEQQRLTVVIDRLLNPPAGQMVPSLPVEVQQAFSRLPALLDPLPLDRPADQIAQLLKPLVEDSGFFFEKKLADVIAKASASGSQNPEASTTKVDGNLDARPEGVDALLSSKVRPMVMHDAKGRLLILQSYLDAAPKELNDLLPQKEITFLRDIVHRLLTHVEGQQEQAARRFADTDAFQVLAHWLPTAPQSRPIRLKLYYPRKQSADQGRHQKVALLLDMDRLGPVRVDLSMVEHWLRVDFYVRHPAARDTITEQAEALGEVLQGWFTQVHISTHLSAQKIEQFESEDMNTAALGRIDIQA